MCECPIQNRPSFLIFYPFLREFWNADAYLQVNRICVGILYYEKYNLQINKYLNFGMLMLTYKSIELV